MAPETEIDDDEMLPEYSLKGGIRGKYANRYSQGANLTPNQTLRALHKEEKKTVAKLILFWVNIAKDKNDPYRELARKEIALALWRWTADGIRNGIVIRDGIKHNKEILPATQAAKDRLENGSSGIIHEHVIPRMMLADEILRLEIQSEEEIVGFLDEYCMAVLVTKDEDLKLTHASMPEGWKWETGDVFKRYSMAEIKVFSPSGQELTGGCQTLQPPEQENLGYGRIVEKLASILDA